MKLIIEIDEAIYNNPELITNASPEYDQILSHMAYAVKNGTPYNPSGDCISREALKEEIQHLGNANPSYWNKCDVVDRQDVLDEIDNAQAVCGNDPRWCERCVSKGKCSSTRPQGNLIKELWNCRNELCLRCGKYEKAYLGACNDCRYNDKNMEQYKEVGAE